MFSQTLITALAVMAGVASAAPAASSTYTTSFVIANGNPATNGAGCILEVISSYGTGCDAVVVLDGQTNCTDIKTEMVASACNGSAAVEFSATPPVASWGVDEFVAACALNGTSCSTTITLSS